MDELSPEVLEQLIALGAIPEEQAQLLRQQQQAQMLRNTEIPKGGMAGRVYVADPFGAIAAGMQRYKGAKDLRALDTKYADTVARQNKGRSVYVDLLRGRHPGMMSAGAQGNGVTTYPVE